MKSKGFSLIESLTALFIISLLISALLHCYMNCKQQNMQFEKSLSVSLELQWVRELLANSIRRAGFSPCVGLQHLKLPFIGIQIEQDSSLKIQRMDEHFLKIIKMLSQKQLLLESGEVFYKKQKIIIAGCERAYLNEVESVHVTSNGLLVNLVKDLEGTLDEKSYVGVLLNERWFVKPYQGLFYQSTHSEEISSLIQAMRVSQKGSLYEVILTLINGKVERFRVKVRGL